MFSNHCVLPFSAHAGFPLRPVGGGGSRSGALSSSHPLLAHPLLSAPLILCFPLSALLSPLVYSLVLRSPLFALLCSLLCSLLLYSPLSSAVLLSALRSRSTRLIWSARRNFSSHSGRGPKEMTQPLSDPPTFHLFGSASQAGHGSASRWRSCRRRRRLRCGTKEMAYSRWTRQRLHHLFGAAPTKEMACGGGLGSGCNHLFGAAAHRL